MKKTLLISLLAVAILNLMQYATHYHQHQAAVITHLADQTDSASLMTTSASPSRPTASQAKATVLPNVSATPITNLPGDSTADTVSTKLQAAGLNPKFASLYLGVQAQTGTPWQLLAAVHQTETGQSDSTSRASYAGAVGPMQFLPSTFHAYALDGDDNGTRDITNVNDAVLTAGRYLAAGGANRGQYSIALYHYNHSYTYVDHVLSIAHRLGL